MSRLGGLALGVVLLAALGALPAFADDAAPPPTPPPSAADGGTPLSAEDQEVVRNLDLLEHMPESKDLDTMLELAQVQAEDDGGPN